VSKNKSKRINPLPEYDGPYEAFTVDAGKVTRAGYAAKATTSPHQSSSTTRVGSMPSKWRSTNTPISRFIWTR
jgi:hypothetical protein